MMVYKMILMHLRGRARGTNQGNADAIQSKEQLYDMFQQILNVKKFEVKLGIVSTNNYKYLAPNYFQRPPTGQPRRASSCHKA